MSSELKLMCRPVDLVASTTSKARGTERFMITSALLSADLREDVFAILDIAWKH
ncbi:hypothetical protein VTO73DRAFT_6452 [Trametes versicolor]